MTDSTRTRERAVWIAVIAVLATSLLWLGTLLAVALLQNHVGPLPQAFVVARALGRVALALVMRVWPGLPLFALGGIMLALVLHRPAPGTREVRHA